MGGTTILVTGATSRIGRHLVRQLAQTDAVVRAMTRRPSNVTEIADLGVDVVEGDFADPSSLDESLAGVDRAFLLSPVLQEMAELQTNFVAGAERAAVSHVVKLSAAGADASSKWDIARWHGEVEARLEASDVGHTHLRPVFYMQNLLDAAERLRETGALERPAPPDTPVNMIDTRDVAVVAAATLTDSGHVGSAYKLTGRRPVTLAEVTETLGNALGLEVAYREVSPDGARAAFVDQGSPEWLAEEQVALFRGFAKGAGDVSTDDLERILGRPPRMLDEFVADHVAEFADP